jgi:hypothetical protein
MLSAMALKKCRVKMNYPSASYEGLTWMRLIPTPNLNYKNNRSDKILHIAALKDNENKHPDKGCKMKNFIRSNFYASKIQLHSIKCFYDLEME